MSSSFEASLFDKTIHTLTFENRGNPDVDVDMQKTDRVPTGLAVSGSPVACRDPEEVNEDRNSQREDEVSQTDDEHAGGNKLTGEMQGAR